MNRTEFVTIMTTVSSAYSKKLDQSMVRVYYDLLGHLPYEPTLKACRRLMVTSKFFPTCAQILSAVGNLESPPPQLAWAEVRAELGKGQPYSCPEFSCEAIRLAVEKIGWSHLFNKELTDWDYKQFETTYEEIRGRAHVKQLEDKQPEPSQIAQNLAKRLQAPK